jgi:hypothetical protein
VAHETGKRASSQAVHAMDKQDGSRDSNKASGVQCPDGTNARVLSLPLS